MIDSRRAKVITDPGQKLVLIVQRIMLVLLFSLFGIQSYISSIDSLFSYMILFFPLFTVTLFSILVSFMGVSENLLSKKSIQGFMKERWLAAGIFLAYEISVCISFLRIPLLSKGGLWFVSSAVFFLIVLIHSKGSENRIEVLNDFWLGLVLYVIINVGGYIAGLKNPVEELNYLREFPSFFSPIFPERVYFPFTASTRMLSIIAGLTFNLSVLKLRNSEGILWGLIAWAGVIGSMVILLGSAARLPVVMTLILAVLICRGREILKWKNLAWVVTVLIAVLPLIVVGINRTGFLSSWAEGEQGASQEQVASVVSLTNRDGIWEVILDKATVSPKRMLAGFGGYGHLYSGASREYGELFRESYKYPNTASAHNVVMQYLIDAGLIGVGVFLLMFITTWFGIERVQYVSHDQERLEWVRYSLIAVMLFLAGSGTTETVMTYLSPISFAVLQFTVLYVIFLPASRGEDEDNLEDV